MQYQSMPQRRVAPSSLLKPLAVAVSCVCAVPAVQAADLQEIIVTASRRDQLAQDIPYNISVMSADAIKNAGISDIAGLSRQIPGFTFIDLGARSNGVANGIIIRGLNASAAGANNFSAPPGNATVTTYLNEIPLFTNLKIADVQQVEVLRGPQGTLYGAGAVGGTVRFVYNDPNLDAFSADLQGTLSQTQDAHTMNYGADGVVNLPLSDIAALRISTGYEFDAGVIDDTRLIALGADGKPVLAAPSNPLTSGPVYETKKDTDKADTKYLRASLLLQPSDAFRALLTYHLQKNHAGDYSGQNPITQNRESLRNQMSPIDQDTNLYALEMTADLGFATLTSATGYTTDDKDSLREATGYIESTVNSYYGGYPRPAYVNASKVKVDTTTQELRLVSNTEGPIDWLAGVYYSKFHRTGDVISSLLGYADWYNLKNSASLPNDEVFLLGQKVDTKEKAAFGELTYHITDDWQVTAGLRYFDLDDERSTTVGIPNTTVANNASHKASDTGTLTKFNTSYTISPDLMVYFTRSEGYRQGGANGVPTVGPFKSDAALVPYKSDTATNWEIGAKGSYDHWLSYSAAVYQIDWRNVQIQLPAPGSGIAILVNGNDAVSRGFEMELKADVTENLQMSFGYSYNDAKLTEDFHITNSVFGYKGDQLPGVPNQQITAGADYFQPVSAFGAKELHYHIDTSFRTSTETALNDELKNYEQLPAFAIWNAALTLRSDSWRVGAFVNNLFDVDGITAVDYPFPSSTNGNIQFISRPRTIGLMVGYSFE